MLRVPTQPWLRPNVRDGSITCTRCGEKHPGSTIGGLEHLVDRLRDFAPKHRTCKEVPS